MKVTPGLLNRYIGVPGQFNSHERIFKCITITVRLSAKNGIESRTIVVGRWKTVGIHISFNVKNYVSAEPRSIIT